MKISVVTGNKDKYSEISSVLREYGIESEQAGLETDEKGGSLEEIAQLKAREAYSAIKKPLIVDDTGIFFTACDNFPGHKAKRVFQELGFDGIMKTLEGKPRDAEFRTVMCYIDASEMKLFHGEMKGRITENPGHDARKGLPYERIFVPQGKDKIVSCMAADEKNRISHRALAARKFAEWFMTNKQASQKE
ncbi:MAG: non-canonical purine NTP pyrophosphatase [Candidatus Aenigmarchaeota archaeon]|nr:non-canonical purine NTP pyrophosphatase [Candidatus Aenigmarchaeota archaeon]